MPQSKKSTAASVRAHNRRFLERIQKYHDVFDSPEGQWVVNDLMAEHGMLSPHPPDPKKMMLKEGERLVVLRILTLLKENPARLRERIAEHERHLETI